MGFSWFSTIFNVEDLKCMIAGGEALTLRRSVKGYPTHRFLVGLPTPPSNIPVAAAEVCVHDG
jgi:hypothetical protein